MTFSKDLTEIISKSSAYAKKNGLEYITPEVLLLETCENEEFVEAFTYCGGSVEELKADLKKNIEETIYSEADINPAFSDSAEFVLAYAGEQAYCSGRTEAGVSHMLHAMFQLEDSYAVYFIKKQDIDEVDLLRGLLLDEDDDIAEDNENPHAHRYYGEFELDDDDDDICEYDFEYSEEEKRRIAMDDRQIKRANDWKQYAPCMNDLLENVNPLIGRQSELDRTIQILCRKDKNNPLHIGEPGVGKTAITYGLARLINEDKVPEQLKGAKIYSVDLGGMLAGTQYRGDFEKRIKKVLTEISKEEKPIVYIDEIHNLNGAGATSDSSFDAANMLKPYLAEGRVRFIGATTFEEYKKYFEKSKSLVRRFQNVEIPEPTEEETVEILKGLKERYEEFHGVKYDDGILEYAVHMAKKHINERFLPDKAIDLIDEAGAYRKLHPTPQDTKEEADSAPQIVDKEIINKVLTSICRVPLESVETDDTAGLAHLEENLKKQIFGQDEAITQVTNAVKFSKAGLLEDGKPLASLLFVGPTGVGKTEIARKLADELGVKLLRFDMRDMRTADFLLKP
jgi:ATP-dependent Clp protease ATP-binding subunit ClpA